MKKKKQMVRRRAEEARRAILLLFSIFFSLLIMAVAMANTPEVPAVFTVSLDFETQALDLDTGNIAKRELLSAPASAGADIFMAYNADRSPHAVVVCTGAGTEIAFVQGVSFDLVLAADIADLVFSDEVPDLPFASTDTVVIRTGGGQVYKLGNSEENENWVTFDYSAVQ